jgi:hypothetical protein
LGKRHNFKKTSEDEVRRLFSMKHSKTSQAILVAYMEREAYLDVLVFVALDAASSTKKI